MRTLHVGPFSDEDVTRLRARLAGLRAVATIAPQPRPFVVITPLGLATRVELPVRPRAVTPIDDWPLVSSALYVRHLDDERLRIALAFSAAWRACSPTVRAERWELSPADYQQLLAAKPTLRRTLPRDELRLLSPPLRWPTPDGTVHLHPFHLPDPPALALESALLDAALSEIPLA